MVLKTGFTVHGFSYLFVGGFCDKARHITQKYPDIRVTVLDVPALVEEARKLNTDGRVSFVGGRNPNFILLNIMCNTAVKYLCQFMHCRPNCKSCSLAMAH